MSPDYSGEPEYMPPEDVNNIPSFINTSEKWSAQVCESDCIHKLEKITYCLAEDCLSCHGESRFFSENMSDCLEQDY